MHFTDSVSSSGDSFNDSDRRVHARQAPHSLSYVHLDETNGGILINLSEGGLAVQAAMSLMEDSLPRVRLQAPQSKGWLEASARVVWTSDSRRTVGVEFVEAPDDFRKQLREWLLANAAAADSFSVGTETAPFETAVLPSAEEQIALQINRSASASRPRPPRSKEIDVAALLTSADTTAALTRSTHSIPDVPAPVLPRVTPEPAKAAVAKSKKRKSPGRYVPMFVVLASLSLVAGWEAGRGNMLQAFAALVQPSAAAPPFGASGSVAHPSAANPASANFEVVDANSQAWLVPFSGPAAAAQGPPLPALPPQTAASSSRTATSSNHDRAFQLWTLAAPQSNRHSSSIQQGSQAPVLPVAQGGSGNALSAAIADNNSHLSLAPPLGASNPNYSRLVPAQLIRRVDPLFPKAALEGHIGGTVKIHARITEDGSVTDVKALAGSPLLVPAAIAAVRKWQYKPETLDGHPVASETDITVLFSIPQ